MLLSKVVAIIAAAGQGKRMGASGNKQYLILRDKPMLAHTLILFQQSKLIHKIILVVGPEEISYCEGELVDRYSLSKAVVIPGGKERQDSVYLGLQQVGDADLVVVHDGARPLLTEDNLEKVVFAAKEQGAAILAVRVKDTIKIVDDQGLVVSTPPRNRLWAVQTPQAFQRELLQQAYEQAQRIGFYGTDEASLVELLQVPIKVIEGSYENLKVTTREDLSVAEAIMQRRKGLCE